MKINSVADGNSLLRELKLQHSMSIQPMIADPLAKIQPPLLTNQSSSNNRIIHPDFDQNGRLNLGNYKSPLGNFVDVYV